MYLVGADRLAWANEEFGENRSTNEPTALQLEADDSPLPAKVSPPRED